MLLIVGTSLPEKRSSPYGLSSTMTTPYFFASARTAFLFSSDMVIPAGFWKVGMRYIIFTLLSVLSIFSSSSGFMPSSPTSRPLRFTPYERKALSAPIKLGFSHITVSPLLQSTLHARSSPCWPPEVMTVMSNSRPMENLLFKRAATCSRRGAYPSVMPY